MGKDDFYVDDSECTVNIYCTKKIEAPIKCLTCEYFTEQRPDTKFTAICNARHDNESIHFVEYFIKLEGRMIPNARIDALKKLYSSCPLPKAKLNQPIWDTEPTLESRVTLVENCGICEYLGFSKNVVPDTA